MTSTVGDNSSESHEALRERIAELEAQLGRQHQRFDEVSRREAMYRGLLDHVPHEVHLWLLKRDDEQRIVTWTLVYANHAALDGWGKRLEEVVGRATDEIFEGADATERFRPIVEQIFSSERPHIWEEYFPATQQTLQMVSIPFKEDLLGLGEQTFASIGLDVTDLRRLHEELERARKMEAIGYLAGGIAHDFNNYLTSILGNAELLHDLLDGRRDLLALVYNIETSAIHSSELISRLLAFARKSAADYVPVAVGGLLSEAFALVEHSLNKAIVVTVANRAPDARVSGDAALLENALINIILNAQDAMPEGGTIELGSRYVSVETERTTVPGDTLEPGQYVEISVADTGTGITEEVCARIFDPFYTTKEHGNGIGLAGVHEIVTQHGGQIDVESEPGKGSRFAIYLPALAQGATVEEEEADVQFEHPLPCSILVVDDEAEMRRLYAGLFEREGHRVISFADGPSAIEYYRDAFSDIDVVVLDQNMPAMNGMTLFRELKTINPDIRAMMATGFGADQSAREITDAGVCLILKKPFRAADLVGALANTLQG